MGGHCRCRWWAVASPSPPVLAVGIRQLWSLDLRRTPTEIASSFPPSLPSAISDDSFCVRKLLNRHTTSAFGVEEGHIRVHWCAGAAAFSAGLSPALPLERGKAGRHHLKKQTALHHHQHQGATTKHHRHAHTIQRRGRRGLDRPELNCLLRQGPLFAAA